MPSLPDPSRLVDYPLTVGQVVPVGIRAVDGGDVWPVDGVYTMVGGPGLTIEGTADLDGDTLTVDWPVEVHTALLSQPYEIRCDGVRFVNGQVQTAGGGSEPSRLAEVTVNLGGPTFEATLVLVGGSGGGGVTLPIDTSDVTGLDAALAAKQATITDGSLTIARTSGLQAALDAKQATITDASLTIARTNGLQTALDAKAATSALVYPRRVSIACGLSPPHSSNTWAATTSAIAYSGYGTSTAASSGAETWTYYLLMDAGTWSFRLVRRTNGTSAKILPTLGGTALTELEGWSSPNAGDVASTETGITVATAGHITFTLTNPNRHASSSGWGWTIQGFEFWRTGP